MRYIDWFHSKKTRKEIMLFLYITVVLDIAGYSLLVPLVTYVVAELGGQSLEIGLCFSGYALCQLISSFIFGRSSDKYGRRPMLLICIVGQFICTLSQALSKNLWLYVCIRVLTGLFDDVFSLCQACIADLTTLSERATYLAQVDAVYSCGFVVGPVLGGIISAYSLDGAQYLAAGFFFVSGLFAYLTINETMKFAIERNQLIHQVHIAKKAGQLAEVDLLNQKIQDLSVVVTSNKPKGKVHVNKFIVIAVVEEFCNKWVLSCNDTIFGVFGSLKFGMNSLTLSLCNAGEGLTNVIQQGYIYDFFLNKLNLSLTLLLIVGGIFDVVAVFVVAFAPNLVIAIIGIFIMIGGYGFASPGAPSIVSAESPPDSQGQALAIVQFGGQLALCIGPVVLGYIYEFLPELPFYVSSFFGLLLVLCIVYLRTLPGGKYAGVIPSSESLMDSLINPSNKITKDVELSKVPNINNNDNDIALESTPTVHIPSDSMESLGPVSYNLMNTDGVDAPLLTTPIEYNAYI